MTKNLDLHSNQALSAIDLQAASNQTRTQRSPKLIERALVASAIASAPLALVINASGAGLWLMIAVLIPTLLIVPRSKERNRLSYVSFLFCLAVGASLVFGSHNNIYFRNDVLLLCVIVPMFYVLGRRIAARERLVAVSMQALIVIAVISAVIAIFESLNHAYLLSNEVFFAAGDRGGEFRARGLFLHSLVLAAFISAVIPLLLNRRFVSSVYVRIPLVLICLLGVLVSRSRGAFIAVGLCLALVAILKIARRSNLGDVWVNLLLIVVVATAIYFLGGLYSGSGTLITSSDPNTASAQFRAELYRNLIEILRANPFGTGFGAVPAGMIKFDSSFGLIDASRTVDSEFVLAGIKFGWLGVVFWMSVLLSTYTHVKQRPTLIGASLICYLLFGIFLALHVWVQLIPIVALLAGLQFNKQPAEGPIL